MLSISGHALYGFIKAGIIPAGIIDVILGVKSVRWLAIAMWMYATAEYVHPTVINRHFFDLSGCRDHADVIADNSEKKTSRIDNTLKTHPAGHEYVVAGAVSQHTQAIVANYKIMLYFLQYHRRYLCLNTQK